MAVQPLFVMRGMTWLTLAVYLVTAIRTNAQDIPSGANLFAGFAPVTVPDTGISWPAGQAIPTFARPAGSVDTIEVQALTEDEQITFSALQGLINRWQPRIYLIDARADEGARTWLETSTIGQRDYVAYSRQNKYALIAKYANELEGVVRYDAATNPHYRNLASTVAGLQRLLPVTPQVEKRLQEQGIELPVKVDLTDLKLASAIETYEFMHKVYWEPCEKRVIISAKPDDKGGDHHHTRDLAAACGAAVVWLDNRIPAERDVLRKFLGDMEAGNAVVLGWYTSERSGITTASEFGISTLPADHFGNLTFFAGIDHRIQSPAIPKQPSLENKTYVTIFLSDGDNIQYTQRAMRKFWDASKRVRGEVPLNWTLSPALVDAAPGIMNYYYSTATANDCFVTGPSGMGYLMPVNTLHEPGAPVGVYLSDEHRMSAFAKLTQTYLHRSGMRVMTIWDDATSAQRLAYANACRQLLGATVQNFKDVPSVRGSVENDRLRFEKLVIPYVGTYEHLRRSMNQEIRRKDKDRPQFLAYQVDVWGEMKPARIAEFVDELKGRFGDQVQFVRADHYFNLYNQAQGLSHLLTLLPGISVTASESIDDVATLIDGSAATLWTSGTSTDSWIQLDLKSTYLVDRYVVRHAGASGIDRGLNTKSFYVHASEDAQNWTTIDHQSENRDDVSDIELKPTRARYLKFTISGAGSDSKARIADIDVFGRVP